MNLNQLEYFVALVNAGNFSLAADKLGISQPALSMQIRNLESELDFKLIDRTRKPLEITPEGEVLLVRAREILALAAELSQIGLELSQTDAGTLRLGIIPTVSPYLVPLFSAAMARKYPLIHLDISEMKTEEVIVALKLGQIDAGILATPVDVTGINFTPLFYEKFFLYVSSDEPVYAQDSVDLRSFDSDSLWYLKEGNCFQNQVADFCGLAGKELPSRGLTYRSNSIESLRRIVEMHGGAAFIPELATITVPAEYEDLVKPILEPIPFREISVAVTRIHTRERLINRLTEVIRENLPPSMLAKPKGTIPSTGIKINRL